MKTIYEITAVEDDNNYINAMAATKEKAEAYLIKNGFEKIIDTCTESEEYQTWIKKTEKTEFFNESVIFAHVKPYRKFIS